MTRKELRFVAAGWCWAMILAAAPPIRAQAPLTRAESSNFEATSRHEDVLAFIEALRPHADGELDVQSMGKSREGREMPVLCLSRRGAFSPDAARAAGLPIVLVIANIHAGEVEGKEAVLMLARDLVRDVIESHHEDLVLVLVPNYNPDGNDRIDPAHRALHLKELWGQLGPVAGVGSRETSEGIDLNRDYMQLNAVESRQLNALYRRWRPDVFIDCHTTNGSIHGYELTFDTAHNPLSGPARPIAYARDVLLPAVSRSLEQRTGLRTYFYGNFRDNDDPQSGWETYPAQPRYGSHYRGLTGRIDILLEAYSYATFQTRCRVTYEILREILGFVRKNSGEVRAVTREAEASIVAAGRSPAPDDRIGIDYSEIVRGRNDQVRRSYPVHPSGEVEIVAYDLESMVAHQVPGRELKLWRNVRYDRFLPTKSVRRPRGYYVPVAQTKVIDLLRAHGIAMERASEPQRATRVETARLVEQVVNRRRFRGGEWTEAIVTARFESHAFEIGDDQVFVSTAQPLGNVAVYLLEAESDDGVASWGWFADLAPGAEYPIRRLITP